MSQRETAACDQTLQETSRKKELRLYFFNIISIDGLKERLKECQGKRCESYPGTPLSTIGKI
ncbi:MAG: hypothetical protein IPF68_16530 [Bacteroidales bacterium]|nr:hypothetical protein [Bacteroidales bacterium]